MPLYIRDNRVENLARQLQKITRAKTVTEAVQSALESALEKQKAPLATRIKALSQRLRAEAGTGGRTMTKDEIDEMWG